MRYCVAAVVVIIIIIFELFFMSNFCFSFKFFFFDVRKSKATKTEKQQWARMLLLLLLLIIHWWEKMCAPTFVEFTRAHADFNQSLTTTTMIIGVIVIIIIIIFLLRFQICYFFSLASPSASAALNYFNTHIGFDRPRRCTHIHSQYEIVCFFFRNDLEIELNKSNDDTVFL